MPRSAGQRLLRKCRSEKKLRGEPEVRNRKDSMSSTVSRASSSGSESSNTTTSSLTHHENHEHHHLVSESDWDPLRLHPPMEMDRSPYVTAPLSRPARSATARRRLPLRMQEARGGGGGGYYDDFSLDDYRTSLRPPPPPRQQPKGLQPPHNEPVRPYYSHRTTTPSLEIHDGFDFGFGDCQLASPSSSTSNTPLTDGINARTSTTPLTPSPRPRLGAAESDSADYFIKRGVWKRRGIVFVSEESKVTDDDCFDLS